MKLIYILLIIIVVIVLLINPKSHERFGGQPIMSRLHVKIDAKGNPMYWSFQSPSDNGELGCAVVPCPDRPEYGDNVTCWLCCNYD